MPASVAAAVTAFAVVLLGEHQVALWREVIVPRLQAKAAETVVVWLGGGAVAVHDAALTTVVAIGSMAGQRSHWLRKAARCWHVLSTRPRGWPC